MKKISITLLISIVILGVFLSGCTTETITKYQCQDGSFKDSAELCSKVSCQTDCPELDCDSCPVKTETKTVEKEVIKYQCSDGTIKDELADCHAVEEPEVEELSDYETSKHLINKKQTRDSFEFTVKYAGFDGTDYKVEFEVKNIGSESEYFQPGAIAILDSDKNQYDVGYSSDYTVSTMSNTILAGVTKKGFWLFEDIPKNSGTGEFTFEIGFMDKDTFSFDVPLN